MGKPFLSFLLEVAAAGFMLYTSANPDMNYAAALWLATWKICRTVAATAGRFAMRAELRYFDVVKL